MDLVHQDHGLPRRRSRRPRCPRSLRARTYGQEHRITRFQFYRASVAGFGDRSVWLNISNREDDIVRITQDRHEPLAFQHRHMDALLWVEPSGRQEPRRTRQTGDRVLPAGASFILNDEMTVWSRTDFLRAERPDWYLYNLFHSPPDDRRRVTHVDGYARSYTCGFGLPAAFVGWNRMGEAVMERSRQQLVGLGTGQVMDVVVPGMAGAYAQVIERRA